MNCTGAKKQEILNQFSCCCCFICCFWCLNSKFSSKKFFKVVFCCLLLTQFPSISMSHTICVKIVWQIRLALWTFLDFFPFFFKEKIVPKSFFFFNFIYVFFVNYRCTHKFTIVYDVHWNMHVVKRKLDCHFGFSLLLLLSWSIIIPDFILTRNSLYKKNTLYPIYLVENKKEKCFIMKND